MKIDLDVLNRIGIILNFLAGFMLAPDLIGTERISKFENYIELKIRNLIKNIRVNLKYSYIRLGGSLIGFIFVLITLTICGLFFIPIVITEGYLLVLVQKTIGKPLLFFILLIVLVLEIGTLLTLYFPKRAKFILIKTLRILIKIMNKLDKFLEKDKTVLTLLTIGGIVFFIVGNLFQFVASFK